jgi:hypothetical protein
MYRSLIESLLGWLVLHLLKNTKVKSVAINSTECIDLNNISVISWWSVLLVEETGVPGVKSQVTDNLYHSVHCCIEYTSPEWVRLVLDMST